MSTTYPLTIDSFDTHVDNVDDVMAADVNNLNDAVVALETAHRDQALMRVKNTSGSTVAANDLGYIDYAGEFKLTSTAYSDVSWAVVVEGAATGSDIIVTNKGLATIVCNGNASVGDYLYTSTTEKQAQPQSYMRPEMLAVVKVANAAGAGGTCVALLHCNRKTCFIDGTQNVISIEGASDSDWRTTQNGAPAAAVITYNTPLTSGSEDAIVPASASELANLVLHNTTKGTSALIDSVNIGADTITVTAAADVAAWEDTDVLVVRSQTNTAIFSGTSYFFDLEVNSTEIPALAVAIGVQWLFKDTGGTGDLFGYHPYEADISAKRWIERILLANEFNSAYKRIVLKQDRFCISWTASGVGTATYRMKLVDVVVAAP